MKDKNKLSALMVVIVFAFLEILVSPLHIGIRLGVGFALALVGGYIVYQLNLFNEEPNEKIIAVLNEQQKLLNVVVENMNERQKVLNVVVENMDERQKVLNVVVENMNKQSEALINKIEALTGAVTQQEQNIHITLEKNGDEQKELLIQMMQSYERVNMAMQEKQGEVIEELVKNVDKVGKLQEQYVEEFEKVIQEGLDELKESMEEYTDDLAEEINKLQRKLSNDVKDNNEELVEGVIKNLNENLGNIRTAMESMLKQYEDIKVYIETLQNGLIELNEKDMELLKRYLK